MPIRLVVRLLLLLLPVTSYGQVFDFDQKLPADTSVYKEVLANGFTVFRQYHNEPRERVSLRLLVKAGSLQEHEDQLGVAHFVEHMAFNGTRGFAKNTLVDFIEKNGSRFGADLNASTSFSETVYKLQVRSDSLALVDTALQIMADWAGAITFATEEVDQERGIIRSEWRSGLSSNQRLQLQAYDALLTGSRYAERLPIGSPELIDTVAAQRLIDYYQRWYHPRNMALVVVGQVDMEWVQQRVQELFTSLPDFPFQAAASYLLSNSPRRSYCLASDPEAPFTRWEVVWQHKQDTIHDTYSSVLRQYTQSIAERILNKRLAALKETQLLPYTFGYSGFSALPANYDTYQINAMCKPEEIPTALALLIQETKRAAQYGFSEAEINREKKSISERAAQSVREVNKFPSSSRAGRIGAAFLRGTGSTDLQQIAAIADTCLAHIQAVDIQACLENGLQAAIQTVIISTNSSLVETMPDSLHFYRLLDSLMALPVRPPAEQQLVGPLLDMPKTTRNYTRIASDSLIGIDTYSLSNGVRVYLKQTDFSNDQIQFRAFSTGGQNLYDDEDYPSVKHGLSIMNESGLDTFRESELLQILSGKQIRISPYISPFEEGLSGASNQKDLETLLQLAHLYFTRPRFDTVAQATYQERQTRIFERIDTDPRSAFGRMMVDKKFDYHLRRPNITLPELSAINLKRAAEIYKERFADIGDFQLIFVGNFSADTLLTLAEQYLGGLPVLNTAESWQDRGLRLHAQPFDTIVFAGQTPKAEVSLTWHSRFNYNDRNERLHHSALRQVLSIRLREILREDLGGVYGVRVNSLFQSIPDSLQQVTIRFNAEPEAYQNLIAQIHQEIDRIAQGDIPDEIIPKIQATRLKSYEEARRRNNFWVGQIKQCLQNDYDWDVLYPGYYEQRMATLNEGDIALIARKYLQRSTLLSFVLLPTQN